MIARLVTIGGRVQGVAFRHFTKLEARRLGLVGWVRNLDDGRVEVHAEGLPAAVDELTAWLRRGPPTAVVESVEIAAAPPAGLERFEVRRP